MRARPAKNVDEYLAGVPEPARSTLKHIRAVIRSVVPKETTEVISYRIPMFKYKGMLVGYAAFRNHCSLFPTGSGVIKKFEKETGRTYDTLLAQLKEFSGKSPAVLAEGPALVSRLTLDVGDADLKTLKIRVGKNPPEKNWATSGARDPSTTATSHH